MVANTSQIQWRTAAIDYLVLRYLAEDLAKELDAVLDGILRSLSSRRKSTASADILTVLRRGRV
jgi:hypothetical protein